MKLDVENVLFNLKNIPMSLIYSEVFLEQIRARMIPVAMVDHFLQFRRPVSVRTFSWDDYRLELHYPLDGDCDLVVIADVMNKSKLILCSAFPKRRQDTPKGFNNSKILMNMIHDPPFDMITCSAVYGYRYGQTVVMDEGFYIDFDIYGTPVLITMFRGAKSFKLRAHYLANSKMEGSIEITSDSIRIALSATARVLNRLTTRHVEREVPNQLGIPPNEFVLRILV